MFRRSKTNVHFPLIVFKVQLEVKTSHCLLLCSHDLIDLCHKVNESDSFGPTLVKLHVLSTSVAIVTTQIVSLKLTLKLNELVTFMCGDPFSAT